MNLTIRYYEYIRTIFRLDELTGTKLIAKSALAFLLTIALTTLATQYALSQKAEMIDRFGNILDEHQPPKTVEDADSLALVQLYHALDGPNWDQNAGWLVDGVEFWFGIAQVREINENEWRVTRIQLADNGLYGELPPEIGDMEYLERLEIRENSLYGEIPPEIGKLENLDRLVLRLENLSGHVPWSSMTNMRNLERIEFNNNHTLTGPISPDIKELFRLERLVISTNSFTGTIPPEIAELEFLEYLRINQNDLTGDIPDLSNLQELTQLRLSGNNFTPGPIPDWIQNLSETLTYIFMDNSNRTGTLPNWILDMHQLDSIRLGGGDEIGGELPDMSSMINLANIYFEDANFTSADGQIPSWLGNIPGMERIEISGNQFSGPVPSSLGNLNSLERLDISNMDLSGELPAQLQNLSNLEILDISNSGLEFPGGQLPSWIGDLGLLQELKCNNCGLSGDLPEWLSNLSLTLRQLRLADNDLTGGIPGWFQNLENLTGIDVSRTNIDVGGTIPVWLRNHNDIEVIGLAGLGLTGEIPAWIGDFEWLTGLWLDDNVLTGPIPSEFGNLYNLDTLNLANNQLTGFIPESLADAGGRRPAPSLLSALILSGNVDLEGPVPSAFFANDYLHVFHFDGTGICEPESGDYDAWLVNIEENPPAWKAPHVYTSVQTSGILCSDVVSISDDNTIPRRVFLHQNYPNPFNPTTTIKYEIPSQMQVSLKIYNVLGQQVVTLVNEVKNAGHYEVNLNATRLSSGTYIYRLETGDRKMTKTMMLIK